MSRQGGLPVPPRVISQRAAFIVVPSSRTPSPTICRASVQSFYYWKRRLGPASAARQPAAFVPVRIAPAPSSSLEIELPNQAIVRVPAEIARERLAEIIQAVGTVPFPSAASPEDLRC